jgi:hypothetical protein
VSRQTAGKTKMKTYKELKQELKKPNELKESRLLRKGVAAAYAMRARNEGKKVEQNLSNAKQTLRHRPNESIEDQVKRLQEGLIEMCDANIAMRKQLGAMTAVIVSGQLMNERTNLQVEKLLRKKR